MASIRKIVEKFLREPKPAEFDFKDVRKVLEAFDYEMETKGGGSHFRFRKKGAPPIIISSHGRRKVDKGYVRDIVKTLNLEGWYEKEKE